LIIYGVSVVTQKPYHVALSVTFEIESAVVAAYVPLYEEDAISSELVRTVIGAAIVVEAVVEAVPWSSGETLEPAFVTVCDALTRVPVMFVRYAPLVLL
jgi:hypothetical protein